MRKSVTVHSFGLMRRSCPRTPLSGVRTVAQEGVPVFPELLSLAVVLELCRKNSLDVLGVCGQNHALANASLNCVSSWTAPLVEHGNP